MQMSNHCSQIMMLRSKLKTKLDPMRYEHSLSVSFTCMNLAMRYGYDIDKAELAGLMQNKKPFQYFMPNMAPGWRRINTGSKTQRS